MILTIKDEILIASIWRLVVDELLTLLITNGITCQVYVDDIVIISRGKLSLRYNSNRVAESWFQY